MKNILEEYGYDKDEFLPDMEDYQRKPTSYEEQHEKDLNWCNQFQKQMGEFKADLILKDYDNKNIRF